VSQLTSTASAAILSHNPNSPNTLLAAQGQSTRGAVTDCATTSAAATPYVDASFRALGNEVHLA